MFEMQSSGPAKGKGKSKKKNEKVQEKPCKPSPKESMMKPCSNGIGALGEEDGEPSEEAKPVIKQEHGESPTANVSVSF